jgi:hypothetical protein
MDTNYSHSIQLEIYRYLMGAVGRKVKTKRLMVVTQKATSLFTHPDEDGLLPTACCMQNINITKIKYTIHPKTPSTWRTLTD